MRQKTVSAVISPETTDWLPPARRLAQKRLNATAVEAREASWVETGQAAQRNSALKQLALLCAALALWFAPGLISMRIDLRAFQGSLGANLGANLLQHAPTTAMALGIALAYIVATGLLIAATASRLTEGRSPYVKTCVLLFIAPAILLSLVSTLVSSLAFFFSLLILVFPALL